MAGEAEEDGYDDEYQLEDLDVTPADYVKPIVVANFRKSWCVPFLFFDVLLLGVSMSRRV